MTILDTVILGLIFFGANLVNAITGFAGVLLTMPGAAMICGLDTAKTLCTVCYFVTSLVLAFITWRQAHHREVVKLITWVLPGVALGIFLYYQFTADYLMYAYGVLILAVAVKQMISKDNIGRLPKIAVLAIMLGAGILQGMFVSGGALIVIYAVHTFKDKEVFRATLTQLWVVLNLVLIVQESAAGALNADNLHLCLLMALPALLGIYIGNRLMRRLSGRAFFALANILLLLSGAACFI